MNIKSLSVIFAFFLMIFSNVSYATNVLNDNFSINGTATTDASYFGSSTAGAIEINTNSIGLVSGSSGRQIHGLFETQTLANPGDTLEAIISFTTPATVATAGEDIRIGLFDHLGRNTPDQLAQNTSYSSASPNESYSGLPGFYVELDVESADPATDIDIRRSDPSATGRLLGTSSGFTAFGSGPDAGYTIEPNTQYTLTLTVTRTLAGTFDITADFGGAIHTSADFAPASFNFGMLAMGASTDAFGSSNVAGDDPDTINDNGIDINSFSVEFTAGSPVVDDGPDDGVTGDPVFAEVVNDVFATDGTDPTITDASYFASSNSSAIEFNDNSIGLVSGSSSRQIHSLFETQTLAATGDFLEATISFTTPDTVAAGGEDIRIGLFDHLERISDTELGQNTSYSSTSPNAVYEGLAGFYLELDVESADPATDLDIRRSDPSVTGRSISTSSGFSSIGNGPDLGYVFEPNTEYTVLLRVTRTAASTLDITAELGGATFTATDLLPASFNIGMLAINASSDAFGLSSTPGEANNGIDLTSFVVQSTTTEVSDPDGGDGGNGGDGGDDGGDTSSDTSTVIVGDNFANNGTLGANSRYFASNSGSAIEFNENSIGVVSGPSGRHIHSLFPTQNLERVGDILRATLSFTTPETVSIGSDDIRFGLFDHLGRDSATELGANTSFSSASPNPLYAGLPGYYMEIDVERFSPLSDLEIGRSTPTVTGRLLNTNGGFARENGPDIGYTIVPETDYTIYLTVERTAEGLDVTATFLGRSFTISDAEPLSTQFGMMALNVSSDAMGVSSVPGEPNNGLDITSFNVEFIRSSVVEDNLAVDGTAETDMDYFASSTSSAIEFNTNSIGLVSGSSGRQIHGLFNSQGLADAGDTLQTSVTFVTPATVATTGEDIRIGLFDSLGRTGVDQLGQNTSFSSSEPNPNFAGLPGYYLELDIENADAGTDLDIRRSDPSTSGRLLTTTSGFTELGNGDDIGYVIEPNTEYTVDVTLVRTEDDELEISADFLGNTFTIIDPSPESFNFGLLALYANSNAVGSSNTPGDIDNGIDITNVTVNYTPFFMPEVIDIPPVQLPTGDHPPIELIPNLPDGVFEAPVETEFVLVWKRVTKVIRFFGRSYRIRIWVPVIIERPVEVDDLTPAEQNALHFDIDPEVQPWDNFELSDWALDAPNADLGPITTAAGNVFGNGDGLSARTQDFHFLAGELFPESEPFFFTGSDGAMVFRSTIDGFRTSQNTSFVRSELREMLRAGDETFSTRGVGPNNWALDHQPENPDIGARGGRLTATLSIDQVTSTGASGQVGRVIIGQIHAEDDEPLRLYYRKLPGNTKGGIYAVHEIRGGDDINIDIIGSRANDASDPVENGILPGELFSYEINNVGAIIQVIIRRGDQDGEIIGELDIDMDTIVDGGTGYDVADEWMYFKAGAYTQNNTGNANDFDQVRFYRLENTH